MELRIGDYFKWIGFSTIYQVTAIRDHGIEIHFKVIASPSARMEGQVGYTTLPQDIEVIENPFVEKYSPS